MTALLVAAVGTALLGVIGVVWGAAIYALVTGAGDAAHIAVYVAAVFVGPVAELSAVQGVTALQRSRLRAVAGRDIPLGSRTAERRPWPLGLWLSASTWRQIAFHLLSIGVGLAACIVVVCWLAPALAITYLIVGAPSAATAAASTAGAIALLFTAPWLAGHVARLDETLARALLGPSQSEELALRVESLTKSHAAIVAATDAERRRIERDLHDGAQQRLVSLAMNLGITRARFNDAPEPAKQVIVKAHEEALLALSEVREFIRGLHPAVLNDRGLDAALSGLAARAPLPVKLTVDMPQPAAPSVEAVAYFIVSEAITNVVKHAHATQAEVTVARDADLLRITVADNGTGGAVPGGTGGHDGGTGLKGLVQRAASVDGTLTIDSPPGGPTVITAELPCE
ncbi:MAG TPA: histidine kinase [Streptosporangiaceae bacterium]|nr:histidine kinase [Streptosporangiaceae bacterium]